MIEVCNCVRGTVGLSVRSCERNTRPTRMGEGLAKGAGESSFQIGAGGSRPRLKRKERKGG